MTAARSLRLAAVTALVAAASLAVPGQAQASACSSSTGVTVVVDFSNAGGGIATTCVAGGGGDSAASLLAVDHALTRDQQYPGVVCKIDTAPADAECTSMPPANAYWGLFWSDGHGGWKYSSAGVDSLDVPDGGSVGMAWQDGGTDDPPGVAPPQHSSSSPSPSPSPSSGGRTHSAGSRPHAGTTPASPTPPAAAVPASPSAAPAESASAQQAHRARDHSGHHRQREHAPGHGKATDPASAGATAAASPSDDPSAAVPVADPVETSGEHLPWWVMPALLTGVFAAAGLITLERRRRRT
jgi:hypothetical protein